MRYISWIKSPFFVYELLTIDVHKKKYSTLINYKFELMVFIILHGGSRLTSERDFELIDITTPFLRNFFFLTGTPTSPF